MVRVFVSRPLEAGFPWALAREGLGGEVRAALRLVESLQALAAKAARKVYVDGADLFGEAHANCDPRLYGQEGRLSNDTRDYLYDRQTCYELTRQICFELACR